MKFSPLLVIALAAIPSQVHAGACAVPEPKSSVLTAQDAEVAGDAVVVAIEQPKGHAPKWKVAGKALDASMLTEVAPGLLTLKIATSDAWATVTGEDGKPVVRVKRAKTAPAELAAPDVTTVKRTEYHGRRGTSVSTVASVKSTPAGAVALVVFDAKHTPLSFAAVTAGPAAVDVLVYNSGSCVIQSEGEKDTAAGDKIELAWLDASGRLSKVKEKTVVAGKTVGNVP